MELHGVSGNVPIYKEDLGAADRSKLMKKKVRLWGLLSSYSEKSNGDTKPRAIYSSTQSKVQRSAENVSVSLVSASSFLINLYAL